MEDTQILQLLWNRAELAIAALEKKFGRRLKQTALNILGSIRDAEESVNDTYLALWNCIPPRRPEPLAPYVYRTGRNVALKRLRTETAQLRNSRYDLSLEELASVLPGESLEQTLDARALGQAIDRFLDTLNRDDRVAFVRRYWFGDSVKSVAGFLGLTQNAMSVRLHRIRGALRVYLIQEGFFDEA